MRRYLDRPSGVEKLVLVARTMSSAQLGVAVVSNKIMSSAGLGVAVEAGSRTVGDRGGSAPPWVGGSTPTPSNSSVPPSGSSSERSSSSSLVGDFTETRQSKGPTWAKPGELREHAHRRA